MVLLIYGLASYFGDSKNLNCVLCDNFEELDTNSVNKTFATIMNKASNNNTILEILIKFYKCELRTFKRILGLK
jgi:hypothetical protein